MTATVHTLPTYKSPRLIRNAEDNVIPLAPPHNDEVTERLVAMNNQTNLVALDKSLAAINRRHTSHAAAAARVGSIGDNRLGGWYSYRAAKAALNQLARTAAIELARSHRQAICVALHPGTVATPLSAPFAKAGLTIQTPADAAAQLLRIIADLNPGQTGHLLDYRGDVLPW